MCGGGHMCSKVLSSLSCPCLQAAASASASANADVVAKKSDIAVPVIITKKQGECQCRSHVTSRHFVAQEEKLDRVLHCSCQGHQR